MEFGVSTFAWREGPLDPALLDRIQGSGWRKIEIFGNRPHVDYTSAKVRRELSDWFGASDVRAPDLHLPFYERTGARSVRWISALHLEERERQAALDETRRALELTDLVKVEKVIVHFGVPGQPFGPVVFDHAYRLVDMIRSFADVRILIETLGNEIATPERLGEFIEVTRFDGVEICHDVAHTSFEGRTLERVARLHLSDPNGGEGGDGHPLGPDSAGTWSSLVETIVRVGYAGEMIFEAGETDLSRMDSVRSRIVDLMGEARVSLREFRERYRLPHPVSEEE
jgi:sugar phosphate isomerase/epimerase